MWRGWCWSYGAAQGHYYPGDFWLGGGDREAGEFGFDPLG